MIYGCMGLGGGWDRDALTHEDRQKSFIAIETALQSGYTRFDHADIYTFGKAETVFGQFLEEHPGLRNTISIQTKAGIRIGTGYGGSNQYQLSSDYLLKQAEQSLQRLQCEYLDVFLLHRPDPLLQPDEIAAAFNIMKERGWVRQVGVSNCPYILLQRLESACGYPLICNQIQLSLGHSSILNALVDWNTGSASANITGADDVAMLWHRDLKLQAWGATDRGRYAVAPEAAANAAEKNVIELILTIARKYAVTPIAVLLAWVIQSGKKIQPVFGSTNPERIRESALATSFQLSREEWYDLWIAARGKSLP